MNACDPACRAGHSVDCDLRRASVSLDMIEVPTPEVQIGDVMLDSDYNSIGEISAITHAHDHILFTLAKPLVLSSGDVVAVMRATEVRT